MVTEALLTFAKRHCMQKMKGGVVVMHRPIHSTRSSPKECNSECPDDMSEVEIARRLALDDPKFGSYCRRWLRQLSEASGSDVTFATVMQGHPCAHFLLEGYYSR